MKKNLFRLFAVAAMMSISLCTWAESGTSTENMAGQGSPFKENGYSYEFTTTGKTVTIKFTLLDDYAGLNAYLWNYTTGFAETGMTVTGNTATATLTNQKAGTELTFACKFAFSGGMSVTKQFTYTVEGTPGGEGEDEEDKPTGAFCQGSDTVKTDGQPFTDGYDYLIQTLGSGDTYSVQVTIKLKDARTGVDAYIHDVTNGFTEIKISFDASTMTTTYTYTDLADLDEISFAVKFAFVGGLSRTKVFNYTVGTDCNGQRPVVEEEDEEDETTALQQVNKSKVESQKSKVESQKSKVIIDGNLYILRNGQLFNAQGARL